MSNGVYGIKRGADVELADIEVLMNYTPNRNTRKTEIIKLPTEEVLLTNTNPNGNGNEILGGMYTLKLPKQYFNNKGIYTILIRPLEIRTRIADVGVLSSQPNIRGLVFDLTSIDQNLLGKFQNNKLVGYRIEYLDSANASDPKMKNIFRIVTSNNKAEAVNQNLNNSIQRAIRYRFNDSATLSFCTVTPNSPNSARPNVNPFIGEVMQDVILTNTFFDPIMLEVEMVDYDMEDLAVGMFGSKAKSIDDGILTIYNFQKEIHSQYSLFEIKDEYTDKPLFEVREKLDTIDDSKSFDNVTDTNN